MRAIFCLLILVAALAPAAPAAKPGCGILPSDCEAWTAQYEGGTRTTSPVIAAAGGRVFVASNQDDALGRQAAIHALDAATGMQLWAATFAHESRPEPHQIAASPDGELVHVTGTGYAYGVTQLFLATFNGQTGALVWALHWPWNSGGEDVWTDGTTLYVAGTLHNDYAIAAFDAATGTRHWLSLFDAHGGFNEGAWGHSYDVAFDLTRRGDNLYVTGVSAAPDGLLEYATLALDAQTGAQRWVARSHGTDEAGQPFPSEAYDVEASPDGTLVYVMGNDGLHALDARSGATVWNQSIVTCRAYWGMFHEECDVAVTPDGARLVAFSHNDLASYDARTGEAAWHRVLRVGNDVFGMARAMVMSPDGSRVYLATPGGRDDWVTDTTIDTHVYETRAFSVEKGDLEWRVVYGRNCCRVHGIAIAPDGGRVFVTGENTAKASNAVHVTNGPPEVLTVAYDTNLGLETLPL